MGGFTGSVTLSASADNAIPSDWFAQSFSSNPTTGTSEWTLTASSQAVPGVYTVTIGGASGGEIEAVPVIVALKPPPLFALSASASSLTVARGSSVTDTITLTPQTGFTGSATLTAAGLPSGVTAAFGTNPATSASVLTLTAKSAASAGNSLVIVEGTSGGESVTIPIALIVTGGGDAGADAAVDGAVDAAGDGSNDATTSSGCVSGAEVFSASSCGSLPSSFNTTGAVCVRVKVNTINGWNASNVQGRTATATGAMSQGPITPTNGSIPNQPGLLAGSSGFVYFNFSSGQVTYSSMACW